MSSLVRTAILCSYVQSNVCILDPMTKDGSYCLICLYVSDMIVTYKNKSMFDEFIAKLTAKFENSRTLGFQIDHTVEGGIFMLQLK